VTNDDKPTVTNPDAAVEETGIKSPDTGVPEGEESKMSEVMIDAAQEVLKRQESTNIDSNPSTKEATKEDFFSAAPKVKEAASNPEHNPMSIEEAPDDDEAAEGKD
jgi:hypothetical protein